MGLLAPKPDPTVFAPVGAYMTNGTNMVEIIESGQDGALGEDLFSGMLQTIEPADLDPIREDYWRMVRMRSMA